MAEWCALGGSQIVSGIRALQVSAQAAEARASRFALASILLLALALRLWVLATHTYLAHPDETFQYFEPAHRLVFGTGVITWEFLDGIRSWLLPGAIAGVMRVVSVFDTDPAAYILTCRLLFVLASLAVPYAGYRIGDRVGGQGAAIVAGLLCALSPQAIYFAPVVMTEPLATDAALLAIAIGCGAAQQPGRARRLLLVGALFGLASALRYQYAPVLGAVALWQHARARRSFLLVAGSGLAVVVLALGVLDVATWGVPFQSVWLNFLRNGPQGVSQAMSAEPWPYYLAYFVVAWGAIAPAILVCLAFGAKRAPALAILAILTIALHSLPPHKELRFIFLATAAMPILIGIGLDALAGYLPLRRAGLPARIGLALGLALVIAWGTLSRATRSDDWHRDGSLLQATAAARAIPEVCGLAIRTARVYRSGGYTYWHRDVAIYWETWDGAQELPGSAFRLRLDSLLNGRSVTQYPDAAMASHTDKFNAIVGLRTDGLPGFTEQSCFGTGSLDDRTFCVFIRPGGCG